MTKIRFDRIERECGYNQKIRAEYSNSTSTPQLIYDFNILIDGEHRATFKRRAVSRGYTLYDIDNQPILGAHLNHGRTVREAGRDIEFVATKGDFEARIDLLLREERIPTTMQLSAAREERNKAEAADAAAEAERQRIAKIKDSAVDLYDALKELLRCSAIPEAWARAAHTVIAKAEGHEMADAT